MKSPHKTFVIESSTSKRVQITKYIKLEVTYDSPRDVLLKVIFLFDAFSLFAQYFDMNSSKCLFSIKGGIRTQWNFDPMNLSTFRLDSARNQIHFIGKGSLCRVSNPGGFYADPDPSPTFEKTLIRIRPPRKNRVRIPIIILTVYLSWYAKKDEFVFLQRNLL